MMPRLLACPEGVVPPPWEQAVRELIAASFGGMSSSGIRAHRRWLALLGERVVAHAAVQRRSLTVAGRVWQVGMVGLVCSDPRERGRGYAASVMRRMAADLTAEPLDWLVLNCGEGVVGFYERLGWIRMAEGAVYTTADGRRRDADPVYGWALRCQPPVVEESVALGEDF